MENGVRDRPLDLATFFCEYSAFMGPVRTGLMEVLPGMNIAYRRPAIASVDRALLLRGFWETTAHPILVRNGGQFYQSDRITISHKKKFSFRLFARQRFLYSRYFAGIRFGREQAVARAAMCVGSLALPPLLLWRIVRDVALKKRQFADLARSLPYLMVFVLIWTWGEMVGYVCGPGDALSQIE